MTGTSGRQRAQGDSVAAFRVATPPDEKVWHAFAVQVTPIFEGIKSNAQANKTLAQLRDTLLPKLISGELRIAEAARFLARSETSRLRTKFKLSLMPRTAIKDRFNIDVAGRQDPVTSYPEIPVLPNAAHCPPTDDSGSGHPPNNPKPSSICTSVALAMSMKNAPSSGMTR
jgi:hypothetical protein